MVAKRRNTSKTKPATKRVAVRPKSPAREKSAPPICKKQGSARSPETKVIRDRKQGRILTKPEPVKVGRNRIPSARKNNAVLNRATFSTSRDMDFASEPELIRQTGYQKEQWPLMIINELIDNAIDACDEADVPPKILVAADEAGITVTDNGTGLPVSTIDDILDFSVRASSREAYVAPDRGAQGNALMCLAAMPRVIDPAYGRLIIVAHGIEHGIQCTADPVTQRLRVDHQTRNVADKGGTRIRIQWAPKKSGKHEVVWPFDDCSPIEEGSVWYPSIRDLATMLSWGYALFNPHLSLSVTWFNERLVDVTASDPTWAKWKPNKPTSPHWYEVIHLERLIGAYIEDGRKTGEDLTVATFLGKFDGLAGSAKQKQITEECGLSRATLSDLVDSSGFKPGGIPRLLAAMKKASRPVNPKRLGIIGHQHFRTRFAQLGCDYDKVEYDKRFSVDTSGLPCVTEAAFGWCGENGDDRRMLLVGANCSPRISNPFRSFGSSGEGLETLLSKQRCGSDEPIVFAAHVTHPRIEYTDRGKTAIVVNADQEGSSLAGDVMDTSKKVTNPWAKQRKREERDASARHRRRENLDGGNRVYQSDIAWEVIKRAYAEVGSNGQLTAHSRQIYYEAREEMRERTGRPVDSKYFTQNLLPRCVNEHPEETANWRITYDARGNFIEPHTGESIPISTLKIDEYLAASRRHCPGDISLQSISVTYPTCGTRNRISAVLFIEKEGFHPLFEDVKLAERYDLAIMSTKGQSTVAARKLVDAVSAIGTGVPLLVLHDFDKWGLLIAENLTAVSEHAEKSGRKRYEFQNTINVIDLGLRLDDVKKWKLASERVEFKGKIPASATKEDAEFLRSNRRVELNAFRSADFIAWIEGKLKEHGIKKLIPEDSVLEDAYRRCRQAAWVNDQLPAIAEAAGEEAKSAKLPGNMRSKIRKTFADDPTQPWDAVVAEFARSDVEKAKKKAGEKNQG